MKNALERLMDPISVIYSAIDEPSYALKAMEPIGYKGGDHSFVIVKDGMKYHPYCLRVKNELKLGSVKINDS